MFLNNFTFAALPLLDLQCVCPEVEAELFLGQRKYRPCFETDHRRCVERWTGGSLYRSLERNHAIPRKWWLGLGPRTHHLARAWSGLLTICTIRFLMSASSPKLSSQMLRVGREVIGISPPLMTITHQRKHVSAVCDTRVRHGTTLTMVVSKHTTLQPSPPKSQVVHATFKDVLSVGRHK